MTTEQRKQRVAELSAELARIMNIVRPPGMRQRNAGKRTRMRNQRIKQLIEARYRHQQIIDQEEQNALAGN